MSWLDAQQPKAVAMARSRVFNPETGRMEALQLLEESTAAVTVPLVNQAKYEAYYEDKDLDGITREEWEEAEQSYMEDLEIPVGAFVEELPFGLNRSEYYGVYIVYPMEYFTSAFDTFFSSEAYFKTTDHAAALENLIEAAKSAGIPTDGFYDVYAVSENDRNMVTIVKVFAYGFITLISLISLANVFNTISTNLMLRRREFAMLKSVGMTRKGFRRMMDYECILYGAFAYMSTSANVNTRSHMTIVLYNAIVIYSGTGINNAMITDDRIRDVYKRQENHKLVLVPISEFRAFALFGVTYMISFCCR